MILRSQGQTSRSSSFDIDGTLDAVEVSVGADAVVATPNLSARFCRFSASAAEDDDGVVVLSLAALSAVCACDNQY